ncbi:interferon kappa [Carlito syrichta]|uniref:Interferon kappa n=1 Tax=Carlito syrichta TaxID=1868482 RepID=A0A1U7SKU4_CARSF|nr:interferon kappa [Carlito syrichta]
MRKLLPLKISRYMKESLRHHYQPWVLWIFSSQKKTITKPDMNQKCKWLTFLMGLFITGILSLDCNFLNVHLRRVTWQNLRLLSSMSNSFPVECLRESKAFALLQENRSYTQPMKRDIKQAFYVMSMQVFNIFSQHTFISTWKQKHLKQILMGLDQQAEYVKQCLEEEEKEDMEEMNKDEMTHSGTGVSQLRGLELRRYFNRIYNFLKEKKYNHCAWELVQVEIRRCLYYFYKFTELLRRK